MTLKNRGEMRKHMRDEHCIITDSTPTKKRQKLKNLKKMSFLYLMIMMTKKKT